MLGKIALRSIALGYLGLLLAMPVAIVFFNTLSSGLGAVWTALTSPEALHALWMTALITAIAVPANTVFGIICSLALVRGTFPGKRILDALIDLPFAISPVVVGLSLFIVYGRTSPFGAWLSSHGIHIIFAWPGMALATIFVSLPFVVREVAPTLAEIGLEQEQAAAVLGASAWQTFWRITLPSIRWGVIYGVVLSTARSLGEFGAVSVVSGHLVGRTETLPLYVEDRYQAFDPVGSYTAAVVLAILAFATLAVMHRLASQEKRKWRSLPAASASPSATS
jgi:sulfate transport system permease protein